MSKDNKAFSFSQDFEAGLMRDVDALNNLKIAIESGIEPTDVISQIMTDASLSAKKYAENNFITAESIGEYIVKQKQSQIASAAQSATLRNCDSIIKAYNSNLGAMGVNQDQFREAVGRSNPILGKYLSTVNSGEASVKGYIASLIGAKAASIGLQVVTMALNMALTSLISIGVSAVFNAISESINSAKDRMDKASDSINDLNDNLKALDDYKNKVATLREELQKGGLTLSEVTDKRKELYEIQKNLIDKYGEEAKGIDIVTGSIENQIKKIDELNDKKKEDWVIDNRIAVGDAKEYLYDPVQDGIRNYLIAEPTNSSGYKDTTNIIKKNGENILEYTGISKWLSDWIEKNYGGNQSNGSVTGGAIELIRGMAGNPQLRFHGSRSEINEYYEI